MDKFTPGPWRYGTDANGENFVKGDGIYEQILSLHDARLIAAAPELLEALRALMDIETCDIGMEDFGDGESVGAYQDEDGQIKDLPLTFGHIRRARAAIAKATLPPPRGHDMDILSAEAKGGKLWL